MDTGTVSSVEVVLLILTGLAAGVSSVPMYLYLRAWRRTIRATDADSVNRRLARNDVLNELYRFLVMGGAAALVVVAMFVPPFIRETNGLLVAVGGWFILVWGTMSIAFSFISYTDRRANLRDLADLARLVKNAAGSTMIIEMPPKEADVTLTAIDTPTEGKKEGTDATS